MFFEDAVKVCKSQEAREELSRSSEPDNVCVECISGHMTSNMHSLNDRWHERTAVRCKNAKEHPQRSNIRSTLPVLCMDESSGKRSAIGPQLKKWLAQIRDRGKHPNGRKCQLGQRPWGNKYQNGKPRESTKAHVARSFVCRGIVIMLRTSLRSYQVRTRWWSPTQQM